MPAMNSFKRYVKKYGIPMSVYFEDIRPINHPLSRLLKRRKWYRTFSEFGRALTELAVKLDPCLFAQAEDASNIVQDVAGSTYKGDEAAWDQYDRGCKQVFRRELLGHFTGYKKFMVKALHKDDLHRSVSKGLNLDRILCIRTEHTVRNDNTIPHNKKLYQLKESFPKKSKVVVEDRVDGSMLIMYQERRIRYTQFQARPERVLQEKPKRRRKVINTPKADHPWRKFDFNKKKIWQAVA